MTATTAPVPGAGLRKSGKVLLIIGIVLLVLSLAAGTIMSVIGFGTVADLEENGTTFTERTELTLEAGEEVQLYAHTEATRPTCRVWAPDTSPVTDGVGQSSTIGDWTSFDSFTATQAGTYTIACYSDQEVLAAAPVSIGGIFSAVGGILIGIFGGGLGLLLAVIGLILLLVGRNQATKAAAHAG